MASNDISDLLIDKDLGPVSAYAMAVAAGYTGTEEQFAEDLANAGQNVQAVTEAAQQATAAASRAADAAATASAAYNTDLLAVTFDQTESYTKGKHVIYSGKYYVLPNGHDANVTWENTTKTEEKVGNEISDLKSAFDDITSPSRNLWKYGDQSFTRLATITLDTPLPAGTYTLSAVVTSSGTDATKSRFIFADDGFVNQTSGDLERNNRSSATITTTYATTQIRLFAETGGTNSTGDTATWSEIQVEVGDTATDYTPPYTAKDEYARGMLVNKAGIDEFNALKNLTIREETPVNFTLSNGYVNANVGDVWTEKIQAHNSYSYINGGIDTSDFNTYDGYIIISTPENASNSARFGFADSTGKTVFVTSNSQGKSFTRLNPDTNMYDLFVKVIGDQFFYSNIKTAIVNATIKLIRIPFAENKFFSLTDDKAHIVKYVSSSGNNDNTGDTADFPYATISKAISEGANTIFLAKGSYFENVRYTGIDIEIISDGATFDNLAGNVFQLENCNVHLVGITVNATSGETGSGMQFKNCKGTIEDCICNSNLYMGFRITGSQLTFIRCKAYDSGIDGFNGHDFTDANNVTHVCDCTFIDCIAKRCGDDGLSFHENGHFTVHGGEYANCISTGIAPHANCSAEIYNAYVHDNGLTKSISGIEPRNPNYTSGTKARVMTFGNLITNNGGYGIMPENEILISVNDKFAGNALGTVYTGDAGSEVSVY